MDPAAEARRLLEQLQRQFEELRRVINDTLSHVPGVFQWVVDRVIEGWNWLVERVQEFWDWFVDKLSYVGNPFMLSGAANGWKESVGGPATEASRNVDRGMLAADDRWQEFGAEQYRQRVPLQQAAMKSLDTDYAQKIASMMDDLQVAIVAFWAGVVAAIISVIVGFTTATGEAVTVVGIPLAPPTALGAIAIALGALGAALAVMYSKAASARSTLKGTSSGIQTWPKFASA
ncbi:hypothetical protein [Microbacterium resistens]|uniref:WXG100 family type VII secretion target n=1 Tax=Microbacterium resistens TaxID=156977 RepID=A0ABY3RRF1_9MICO|nr:hypothetical protein [Microbacterium resistens]MBW1638759.1 hypothetical protein [Microbacterium resistens]UGS25301.1 hypothetical protein K8F61_11450 [Microbacterium resistens]